MWERRRDRRDRKEKKKRERVRQRYPWVCWNFFPFSSFLLLPLALCSLSPLLNKEANKSNSRKVFFPMVYIVPVLDLTNPWLLIVLWLLVHLESLLLFLPLCCSFVAPFRFSSTLLIGSWSNRIAFIFYSLCSVNECSLTYSRSRAFWLNPLFALAVLLIRYYTFLLISINSPHQQRILTQGGEDKDGWTRPSFAIGFQTTSSWTCTRLFLQGRFNELVLTIVSQWHPMVYRLVFLAFATRS